jgi:hypothetical protein
MKSIIALSYVIAVMAINGPADARGCLKGAAVGGAAGHYVGHHGLLGAAAGCLIGRHEANKHEIEQERVHKQSDYHNVGPEYH